MDRPSSNMGMRFAAYLPSPVFGLMSALLYREGRAAGSRGAWGGIPNLIKSGDLCLHREKENESTGAEPMRPNTMSQDGRAQRERRAGGRNGSPAGPAGSSRQAGDVSLWRWPGWLWAALVGFSFKHHDPGLEMKKRKGSRLLPSHRKLPSLPSAASSTECPWASCVGGAGW